MMVRQKILLTGATGMLGRQILNTLVSIPEFEVFPIGRSNPYNYLNFIFCDITELDIFESKLDNLKPDIIIHCAADVNVNHCEIDRENAYALHVGTSSLLASKKFVDKHIYISTDSVFDGQKGDYKSTDLKNPLNYYSKTKSMGEDEYLKSKENSIVIRTNIIGYSLPFKKSLFEWAFNSLKNEEKITGFSNVFFNPLYVKTLAKVIVNYVLKKEIKSGILHVGCKDHHSKYDFIKLLAATFGFDQSLITPAEADKGIIGVPRPLNTALNTNDSSLILKFQFPTLKDELLSIYNDLKAQ